MAVVDKDGSRVAEMPFPEVKGINFHMNNKYFTMPVDGLQGFPQLYTAMKRSLGGSIHDATGHSCMDYNTFVNKMTLIGVDCEKSPGAPTLLKNGLNTRENAYQFSLEIDYDATDVPANAKLVVITLHKKLLTFSDGMCKVLE